MELIGKDIIIFKGINYKPKNKYISPGVFVQERDISIVPPPINYGLNYAPFIPMLSATDFEPKKRLSSRYAIKMVDNRYYETIRITP